MRSTTVKRNILLNPGPSTTTDTVKQALVIADVCPRESEVCNQLDGVSRRLARVLDPNGGFVTVPFAASGTGALEAMLGSITSPSGRLLIVDNGDYGARLADIAARLQVPFKVIRFGWGKPVDLKKVREVLTVTDFTHLVFVHHETSTGMLNPLERLVELADEFDVRSAVDTMSSLGAIEVPILNGLDFVVSSANKCLQGMAGLSFVICRKSALAKLKSENSRGYYFDLLSQHKHISKYDQSRFTIPPQVLSALDQALREFELETLQKRRQRYDESYRVLVQGLKQLGFRLLLDDHDQSRILVAVLAPQEKWYNFPRMHDTLYAAGFTIYPGKPGNTPTFRLSVMGAIDATDIRLFLSHLSEFIHEQRQLVQ